MNRDKVYEKFCKELRKAVREYLDKWGEERDGEIHVKFATILPPNTFTVKVGEPWQYRCCIYVVYKKISSVGDYWFSVCIKDIEDWPEFEMRIVERGYPSDDIIAFIGFTRMVYEIFWNVQAKVHKKVKK